jgi:reactive intermediate/imine deaminase
MRLTAISRIACLPLLLAACELDDSEENEAAEHQSDVEYVSSEVMAGLDLPFSAAVRVGDMIYVSGNIGNVPGQLTLVEGGIGPETRQTMENIRATLEQAGSSMDRVVKCTVMMADMDEWAEMNSVYVTFFPGQKPARAAFGATGLALGARVEIDCMAHL